MATTVRLVNNFKVEIDDATGTPVDISNQLTSVTLDYGRDSDSTSSINSGTETTAPTLKTWSVSLDAKMDSVLEQLFFDLWDGPALGTITITDEGPGSPNNPQWTGEVTWTSFPDFGGETGAFIEGTADGEAAGDLTRSFV